MEGSLEYRQYEDKEGQTRYVTEIRGRDLIMLGGRGENAEYDDRSRSRSRTGGGRNAGGDDFDEFSNESLTPAEDDLPF